MAALTPPRRDPAGDRHRRAGERDRDALVAAARRRASTSTRRDLGALVDELLSKYVEPKIAAPDFLMDYPVELSPFAKDHRSEPGLVERFECFAGGMEFANAFTELNDPDEQRARFEEQQRHQARATRRPSRTTRTTCARSSTACRPPAASASASTAS